MEKKASIMDLTDEQIAKIVRVLYSEYEQHVEATLGLSLENPVTPKFVVGKLREMGLDQYASSLYVLVAGLFLGGNPMTTIFKQLEEWRAVYDLADQLGVPVDTIQPSSALQFLRAKK